MYLESRVGNYRLGSGDPLETLRTAYPGCGDMPPQETGKRGIHVDVTRGGQKYTISYSCDFGVTVSLLTRPELAGRAVDLPDTVITVFGEDRNVAQSLLEEVLRVSAKHVANARMPPKTMELAQRTVHALSGATVKVNGR